MTPAQFRKAALALPDVVEGSHHDHPDFRAGGRVFASLFPDGERAMVKLPPDEQRRLCERLAGAAVPATGAWGRAGCTVVRLANWTVAGAKDALVLAWQAATAGPVRRRRRGAE